MQNSNQLQQPNIDFSQADVYKCDDCGNDRFVVQYLIKKFSALVSPTGNEMLTPIQVFCCASCKHINEDFLPDSKTL